MGKVHPSAWDRLGYGDAIAGLSAWPPDVAIDADGGDQECLTAYKAGYERGAKERASLQPSS